MKEYYIVFVIVLAAISCSKKATVKPVVNPTINVEVQNPQQDEVVISQTINNVNKVVYDDVPSTSDFKFQFQAPVGAIVYVSSSDSESGTESEITIIENGNNAITGAESVNLTVK